MHSDDFWTIGGLTSQETRIVIEDFTIIAVTLEGELAGTDIYNVMS